MKPIKRLYLSTDEIHLADASLVLELNSCGGGLLLPRQRRITPESRIKVSMFRSLVIKHCFNSTPYTKCTLKFAQMAISCLHSRHANLQRRVLLV